MSKRIIKWGGASGACMVALLVGVDAVSAQDNRPPAGIAAEAAPQNGPADALPDIVVTAQKRSERINDVPLSITAATGEDLAKAGITDASQLAKIVPGFTYQLSPYGTPVYGLRGISFFDTSGIAQPAVSVYVDQAPLPLSILTRGATLDIERVEVLKGSQGTLFGENATGGAINYIAAKPTSEFAAGVDALYGRFNQAELGGFVSGPLGGNVSVRIAARTEQRDDWQRSTSRRDGAGQRNFNAGRVLLDWRPDAVAKFELAISGWKDRSDSQVAQFRRFVPQIPAGGYPPAYAALAGYGPVADSPRAADWDAGFDLRRDDRFFQAALRSEFELSDRVSLTSLTSYIRYKGAIATDPDGTNYNDLRNRQVDDVDIFNQETRVSYDGGPLRLMAGGYYQYAKLYENAFAHLDSTNSFIAGIHNTGGDYVNHQKVDTYAAFGSVDLDVGGGVKLQASGRYTDQERRYSGCARDDGNGSFAMSFSRLSSALSGSQTVIRPGECFTLDPQTFKPAGLVARSLDQDNVSWKAGVSWEPDSRTLLYVNATKGFKAGGFATLPYAFTGQINPVVQEAVQAYEAGFKLTLGGGRLQVNGAAFHYGYRDKQIQGFVLIQPFGNLPALINVPRSKIDGAEVGLAWQPVPALRLSAAGTYVDARVSRPFTTLDPYGGAIAIDGQQLPASPKWQGNVDMEYRFYLGGRWVPYAGAALAYQSRSYAAFGENSEFILPERALLDLRAGAEVDGGRWRLEAFGHNVTDKYYWVNVSRQLDTVVRLSALPATYGVRATFRY